MKKGEVTAFLSLIFILLLSLVASIIESASLQVLKNRKRGEMDLAIQSVFAEYQADLLKEYDIFALEGTYESGTYEEEKIWDRLQVYGLKDVDCQMEKIQFLTDDGGRAFREQVIAYEKHKLGVSQLEELTGESEEWEEHAAAGEQYEQEGEHVSSELEEALQEQEETLPDEENPLQITEIVNQKGLLNVVCKDPSKISTKKIVLEELPSHRQLQKGKGTFRVKEDTMKEASKLYFNSYLLEKFQGADTPVEDGSLSYELEYIIHGEASDRENLEAVLWKLLAIRFVSNYGYLQKDEEKKAEAAALAATLAGILALPAITEVLKQAILLAWAFGESIMDLRSLLDGHKVAFVKTRADWQLTLSALLKLANGEELSDGKHSENGLSYKEYLKIILFLEKQETCTMRGLDMLEMKMRWNKKDYFRVDQCISKMCVKSRCRLRRAIEYQFLTKYGYQ